jgi:hypothetical protein
MPFPPRRSERLPIHLLLEIVRQEADLLPAKDRVSFLPLPSNALAHATIMICHPTDREALSVRRRYRLSREKREYTEHLREGQTEHLRATTTIRGSCAGAGVADLLEEG